jgi:ubiquinone/menaquinone biosynthesis C-methylase UbiE
MMSKADNHHKPENRNLICPAEAVGILDNPFRKLFHNPKKILHPYIKTGMTILDVGCGAGTFSVEMAKMLNGLGKVICADIQEKMLNKVRKKIKSTNLEQIVELHKSGLENIGVVKKVDFVLAFWMFHEVRHQEKFLKELISILKPNGLIFIIEPKVHVTKTEFRKIIDKTKESGLRIVGSPKVFFSRTAMLST